MPPNIEPLLVLPAEGMLAPAARAAGVETVIAPPGPSLGRFGGAFRGWSAPRKAWVAVSEYAPYTWELRRLIERARADLVHTDDPRGVAMIGPAAKLAGRPLVGHLRGEADRARVGGLFWRLFEELPDRIITVAESLRAGLGRRARDKSVTIHNGTGDLSARGAAPAWLQALRAQGVLIVCCMASVVPFKGHHHLLEAVARLNARGWAERTLFLCAGDLPPEQAAYQGWLRRRRQELGLDNVLFTGWQHDPFSYYRAADVSVLPSVSRERLAMGEDVIQVLGGEGFPRTHLEAMSMGLPVVGTSIAGAGEQIADGETGFLVPPSDPGALAHALERLLADAALRRKMGAAARERVRARFSTEQYVASVVDVYRDLVPRGRAGPAG